MRKFLLFFIPTVLLVWVISLTYVPIKAGDVYIKIDTATYNRIKRDEAIALEQESLSIKLRGMACVNELLVDTAFINQYIK